MKRREELDKYHDLSEEELKAETARLKESLFRLKFKLALGEADAVKRIREERAERADFSDFHKRYYDHLNRLGLTGNEVADIARALASTA